MKYNSIMNDEIYDIESFNNYKKFKKSKLLFVLDPFTFITCFLLLSCVIGLWVLYFFQIKIILDKIEYQILNGENIQNLGVTLANLRLISSNINITSFQNNIAEIAYVLKHYAPPN
jgi:hypothetical protein